MSNTEVRPDTTPSWETESTTPAEVMPSADSSVDSMKTETPACSSSPQVERAPDKPPSNVDAKVPSGEEKKSEAPVVDLDGAEPPAVATTGKKDAVPDPAKRAPGHPSTAKSTSKLAADKSSSSRPAAAKTSADKPTAKTSADKPSTSKSSASKSTGVPSKKKSTPPPPPPSASYKHNATPFPTD
eukprot:TRINITY_DN25020_c0_g1_i1.p2 TRINITY_DN25020_c0_g1~~TRINITY_DN25020_c0_g1_i1.p2  ORF type:complete len:185 (-),score=45.10 TRINITY_DN25020_c0_g1_i1:139-693(-)